MSIQTTSVPARAIAAATALADHEALPLGSFSVNSFRTSIYVPSNYHPGFDALREVATWAREFNAEIIISLSSSGMADVETNIELGGEPVGIRGNFGTAQAYELGRILQRELNRDVSIHISAADVLAAIDQAVQP